MSANVLWISVLMLEYFLLSSSTQRRVSSLLLLETISIHFFLNSSSELIGGLLLKFHWTGNIPDLRQFLIAWMLVARFSFLLQRVLAFRYRGLVAAG